RRAARAQERVRCALERSLDLPGGQPRTTGVAALGDGIDAAVLFEIHGAESSEAGYWRLQPGAAFPTLSRGAGRRTNRPARERHARRTAWPPRHRARRRRPVRR